MEHQTTWAVKLDLPNVEIRPVAEGRRNLRPVAEAAYEAFANGTPIAEVTSVWRVLDAKASVLKKVSFDPAFILDQRAREAL